MNDDQFLEIYAHTANGIVTKLNASRRRGSVTEAVELLLGRIVGAGNSLTVLCRHAPASSAFDGLMVLRGIYDAMLQTLYILKDSAHREERSRLYLDFYWVEKKQYIEMFDTNPTYLAGRISKSPNRSRSEAAFEEKFREVQAKFKTRKGPLQPHWYKGSLRELAKDLELESEYEIIQKQLSGAVHASAYSLKENPPYNGFDLAKFAWQFSFRVLGNFSEYAEITLSEVEKELIKMADHNVFDDPTKR